MPKFALPAALVAMLVAPAFAGAADPPQPAYNRDVLKATYQPSGGYKPGDAIPLLATDLPVADKDGLYNPSGHWAAYDTNIFETLNFPLRQANDTSNTDAPGSGDPRHGWCPPDPTQPGFIPGRCANHAAEYRDFYERTMKAVLKDYGVVVKRYDWDTGPDQAPVGLPGGLTSRQGKSQNIVAIVPGADHPEQMVVVGAHYDQTDGGPASTWDSAEGHATIIRMAAIMAEYWKKTGTRPSATVVFSPWDQEENGSLGSAFWLRNNVTAETAKDRVRGYFNDDPCSTGYPAFYHGNPAVQVPMMVNLGDPSGKDDEARFKAFNDEATQVIDEFFADVDDTVDTVAGPMPVFDDASRSKVAPAVGGLLLFGSDYSNFEAAGVPFFNPGPDILGPHADGSPGFSAEGITLLHTPRDNIPNWNGFTSFDQTGLTASDGWMTGQEFCAQMHARFMLKPNMGGAQTLNTDPVAFSEALPAGTSTGKLVSFESAGSYQYADTAAHTYVPQADLQFKWEFGDGSPEAFGPTVKHAYKLPGTYKATLTVTNRNTHTADTTTIPVQIDTETPGTEVDPAGQNADPGLRPQGSLVACQATTLAGAKITRSGKGLKIDAAGKTVRAEVLQVAGKKFRTVADFTVNGSGSWDGKGGAKTATYVVRLSLRGTGVRIDSISRAFERRGGTFRARKAFQRADSCTGVSLFRLTTPRFGSKLDLGIAFTLAKRGKATVEVFKGKRRVARLSKTASANVLTKFVFRGKNARKGEYRIVLRAAGKKYTLYARRG